MPRRVTAEWMAQQWRDGRRTKSKIGSYPAGCSAILKPARSKMRS
jgi:hypothetical protein